MNYVSPRQRGQRTIFTKRVVALPTLPIIKGNITSDDSKKCHSKKLQLAQSYKLKVDNLKFFTIKTMK